MQNSHDGLVDKLWSGQVALGKLEVYNGWISGIIKPYLGDLVLEIGAGTGNVTKNLIKSVKRYSVLDSNFEHIEFVKSRFNECRNFTAVCENIENSPLNTFKDIQFDTAISINCLEHIHNDEIALKNIYALLAPNARLILLVPALKIIYNSLDKNAGHYRRYSKKDLRKKIEAAGFKIEKISFFNFLGVFFWMISGLINSKTKSTHLENPVPFMRLYRIVDLLSPVVKLQKLVERLLPVPFGASLFCVARKL